MQPEEQDAGKRLVLPESAYNLAGEVQAVYVENHAEEEVELCIGQRVGTVHSLYIDKEVWLKEELSGRNEPEVRGGSVNNLFESKYKTEEDKKKFIRESFKIDENEILNKDEKLKEEVIKMFLENFSALALHPNHYGKTDLLELKIELEAGTIPKRSKVRPLNPDQRANLKEQLDEWLEQGVIEPATSPWASPLVPVKKKDGRTRWVTDLRLLNAATIKDAYPLTNIQENLQKLKGAKIFTSLDACGAYHCVQIAEESRDCTAFISPFGTFRYIRMPFGLSNAGSVYSRMLDMALAHLPAEYWLSYLDDILVYSMDSWEHLEHLRKIVHAHTKAGIKIQPSKTKIFQSEVEYLGHKVSKQGVEMIEKYVKDIQNWPRPSSCREMSSFLGFAGYYRGFIPRYSALTNRMNTMKKADKFIWTEDMEKDFVELKKEFTAGKIQAYPDFDSAEPFILTTDWSAQNIAGVLSQKQEGVERFIGCFGRKCNTYEKHYPSMKGELLALVKSMARWKHILQYRPPFLVYTDASSLKYIVSMKPQESIFQHWFAELAQYNFIVIHKKGVENINADALSRATHLDEPTQAENEEYQAENEVGELKIKFATDMDRDPAEVAKEMRMLCSLNSYPAAVHSMSTETRHEIVEGNELRKLQEADEVWKEVIKWVIEGEVPKLSEVRGKVQEVLTLRQLFNPVLFVIHNGVLCYNRHTDPTKPYDALRICVPEVKLKETFQICHEGIMAGHRGVNGTLDKFQRTFFVVSARDKIRTLVNNCNVCLTKERSVKNKMGPHVPSTVGNVGEKVFIDLVTLSETVRKNRYLLTVQDGFTRFASAYPICNKEAGTVARVLIREHFSTFGLPNQIHSDNGREFVNQLWQELFLELKILHTKTPPYNPSSNIIERWHRTIVSILRAMGPHMQEEWDLGVKAACLAYNTTVHSSTRQTPFYATFGREATVPVHWIYPVPKPTPEMEMSEWTETMQDRFIQAYSGMREMQQNAVRRNAQYYKPLISKFTAGTWVWCFDPKIIPGSCDKLRSYWAGPYQIVRLIAPALAEIMAVYEKGKTRLVSLDILKEFRGENGVYGYPSDPPHPSINNEEEVREIPNLDSNTQGNTKEREEGVKRTRTINPGNLTVEEGSTGCSLDGRGSPPPLQPTLEDLDIEMVPVGGGEVEEGDAEEIEPGNGRIMDNNDGGETGQPELEEYNEPGDVKITRSEIDMDNSGEEAAATETEMENSEEETAVDVEDAEKETAGRNKRQMDEVQKGGKWRRREAVKRNRRELPRVIYEELSDDQDSEEEGVLQKRCKETLNHLCKKCTDVRAYGPITELEGEAGGPIGDEGEREAVREVPRGPISARKRQSSAGLTAAEDQLKTTGGVQLKRVQQRGSYKILWLLYLLLITKNVNGVPDKEYEESPHFLSTYDCGAPSAMRRLVLPARCMKPKLEEGTSAGSVLYTESELLGWEEYSSFPAFMRSSSQRLLNGALMLTGLVLEYLAVLISFVVAAILYGSTVALAALIHRITLDWSRMRSRSRPRRVEAMRLEPLLENEVAQV